MSWALHPRAIKVSAAWTVISYWFERMACAIIDAPWAGLTALRWVLAITAHCRCNFAGLRVVTL
eukprot:4058086-Pleurochrysis_carterae.AAC.1